MAFVDEVNIHVQSGAGGNGCVSFRREKFVPRGGPDGGNGGNGGSVFFVASRNKSSLLDFKYQPHYRAKRGQHGMGKDMCGRNGGDQVLSVPLGTSIFDLQTGQLLADLTEEAVAIEVVKGGRGGRGNKTFATSRNRAPRMFQKGRPAITAELRLELKLIADVGLVGLPNAGKSTLLRTLSRAKPKVADYPFTTLQPHLGVAHHKGQGIVLADLPGLIEGAAQGAGLGHLFLRHATRNRILLHLVDISVSDEVLPNQIKLIHRELEEFDPQLVKREILLVFTKIDLLSRQQQRERKELLSKNGYKGLFISAQSGQGLEKLLDYLSEKVQQWNTEE